MKVMISGITRMNEVLFLSDLRPDYAGFIFNKASPHYVTPGLPRFFR